MVLLIPLIGDGVTAAAAVELVVVMVVVVGVERILVAGWATSGVLEASSLVFVCPTKAAIEKY